VRDSGGTALTVSDAAMQQMSTYAARRAGIWTSMEAAATLAAYHELLEQRVLAVETLTVLFFTGSGWAAGDVGN